MDCLNSSENTCEKTCAMKSTKANTVIFMQKYHSNPDFKKTVIERTARYKKKRCETDESYKLKCRESQKAYYNAVVKHDEGLMLYKRIIAYLHLINMKAEANRAVTVSKKHTDYGIYFDETTKKYRSTVVEAKKPLSPP
jgi:hypothetical protein